MRLVPISLHQCHALHCGRTRHHFTCDALRRNANGSTAPSPSVVSSSSSNADSYSNTGRLHFRSPQKVQHVDYLILIFSASPHWSHETRAISPYQYSTSVSELPMQQTKARFHHRPPRAVLN
jgi:hypothetical protein